MPGRFPNIPDLDFAVKDPSLIISNVVTGYQAAYLAATGNAITLAQGDPRYIFLLNICNEITLLRILIDAAGKNELLNYATGAFLDNFALVYGPAGYRLQSAQASTLIQFTLASALSYDVTIPSGTQVGTSSSIVFSTSSDLTITAGNTTGTVEALCLTSGSLGNGFVAAQINTLINWSALFVVSASNTTTSAGGADLESDDAYAARLLLVPGSFATTGTPGAYLERTYAANDSITNAAVWTPAPGFVGVTFITTGNTIPGTSVLNQVQGIVGGSNVKNLTDLVNTIAPATVSYDITGEFWIAPENASQAVTIQSAISAAATSYGVYVNSQIGRNIDPGKLTQMLYDAGASRVTLSSPSYTALSNGSNSLTATTASITIPAVSSNVSTTGVPVAYLSVGQQVNIGGYLGATFSVVSITGSTVVLENLGLPGSAAPSTAIDSGSTVVSAPQVGVVGTITLTYEGIDTSN